VLPSVTGRDFAPEHTPSKVCFDVFGDGAIVAVPLRGHTPGSTGYLVHGHGGVTYFLIGDFT